MLKQITIANFALVGALDVAFSRGLTVVTGESGAGKSVFLNALALVLGERAGPGLIRPGAQRAEVNAEFDVEGRESVLEILHSHELGDPEQPHRCLLRRLITREGRSRAFINGTPVNLNRLRSLAGDLVDIHSQDENQRLVQKDVQLGLLDAYGVDAGARHLMVQTYRDWQRTERAARRLQTELTDVENRAELLRYQLAELDGLNLVAGDFEALATEHRRLAQAQQIQATVMGAVEGLSALDTLRRIQGDLGDIDDIHPALEHARESLTGALELGDDALRDLRAYFDALELNPEQLAEFEERLNLIQELARKHRVPPQNFANHAEGLKTELATLCASRDECDSLREQAARHRDAFERAAKAVGNQRRVAARGFADAVSACMDTLGIKGGRLTVQFDAADSEQGLETVEFLVAANPNYAPGGLKHVASGGERARISLAIEMVAAERARLPCLVLDEADVGVGGPTADVIGRLLRRLGHHTQVICVTHAPQVAVLGDAHLLVKKDADQEISIQCLSDEARIDELARMLAGAGVTEKSRAYARTLLEEAG